MRENRYSPSFEPLEQFKRDAERCSPAPIDFSERVMHRIEREVVGFSNYRVSRPKRMALGISLIALSMVLLCGFTYALTTGVLYVKDDAGHEVMQVKSPDTVISAEQLELQDRIKQTIHDQLQQGEAALILIGKDDIDAVKRYEEPKAYLSTYRGDSNSSMQAISSRLIGTLSVLNQLGDQVKDYKITKVEVLPFLGVPRAVQQDKWVEETDPASGYSYAYYKFKTNEKAYISASDVVKLTYQKEDGTFTLMATSGDYTSLTVYDPSPSSERIYEVEGIPIYQSEGRGESFLIWNQPAYGEKLMYMLKSDADLKEQLDFAEAVIQAISE